MTGVQTCALPICLADGELHLLANTGPTRRTLEVALRTPRAELRLLDPASGQQRSLLAEGGEIELHPYQALLLLSTDKGTGPVAAADPVQSVDPPSPLRLEGPWTLTREGEAPLPVTLPHLLHGADAADLRPLLLETEVQLDEDSARGPLVLDLGEGSVLPAAGGGSGYRALLDPPVREIAAVLVDGQEVGLLWRPPYRLDLTGKLRTGTTRLGLRIHGTTAAAAARPDHAAAAAAQVAEAHAAYGERFQQQELEKMLDGVATGLGSVPVLHRRSGRSEL